jgi:hypothetical protein
LSNRFNEQLSTARAEAEKQLALKDKEIKDLNKAFDD